MDPQGEDDLEEKARLFSLVDILQPLSREEIADLARRTPDVHLRRSQTYYTPEFRSRLLFLVLTGRVRLYDVVGGSEFTFLVVSPGNFFGELVFTEGGARGTYAQALEPSRIAIMRRNVFEETVMRNPRVGLKMVESLSERLAIYNSRLMDIGFKEVPSRLAGLILQLVSSEGIVTPEGIMIPTHYTHRQLGTMIGANREAVTNAFTRLRGAGAVELVHRHIYIRDAEALKHIASGEPPWNARNHRQ